MGQRIWIKNAIKCSTTLEVLNVTIGDSCMKKNKRFQEGCEDVENEEYPGHPSTITIDDMSKK